MFLSKWVICRFHVNLPGCKMLLGSETLIPADFSSNLRVTLPKTNTSPANIPYQRKVVFQPSFFRGYVKRFFPQMFEQISIRPNGGVMKL